ncbi:MAG: ABC transporter permease [Acidimicrobiia bacterium]
MSSASSAVAEPAVRTRADGRGERPNAHTILVLARKELRDAVRDRWFWLYAGGFALLAGALTSVAIADTPEIGFAGFGRTGASLVALAQLVIPLMGLTLGARSIAGQRERGTLRFLLGHPVSRTEAFVGIWAGMTVAMLAAVAGGFGLAGVVATVRSAPVDAADLVVIALCSWLLAVGMIGVGMLLSVLTRKSATALGASLAAWILLVFVGDLGLMGTAVSTQLPTSTLFLAAVANPVEAFRLTAVRSLQGSLDVLGPAGSYAVDRFGDSVVWLTGGALVLWAVVPTLGAWWLFRRGTDL